MEWLFFFTLVLTAYSYLLYPAIMACIARNRAMPASSDQPLPPISIVITVHNEEARIQEKLENTLAIDYPKDKLDIVVASDCSTDDTESIVQQYSDRGIRLVRADQHNGKEYAQLCAIRATSAPIIVFSDVATMIPKGAINKLAMAFSDPRVGAVSSEDRFISNDGRLVGEGAYVKYEMWLRRIESKCAGVVGLSGSFFAARREVCQDWDILSPSDFNTALNCGKAGLIAISDPGVQGHYTDVQDASKEYRRKVRTVIRGITAIARHPEVLSLRKLGLFSFQVWGHKIMRWLVPWFMALLLLLNVMLLNHGWFYILCLAGQLLAYAITVSAWAFPGLRRNTLCRVAFYFVQVNIAIAHATIAFLGGKRMTVWQPTVR